LLLLPLPPCHGTGIDFAGRPHYFAPQASKTDVILMLTIACDKAPSVVASVVDAWASKVVEA
jgi:hypothetical protein